MQWVSAPVKHASHRMWYYAELWVFPVNHLPRTLVTGGVDTARNTPLTTRVLLYPTWSVFAKGRKHKHRRTLLLGSSVTPRLETGERMTHETQAPVHMCYHVKLGRSASKVCAYTEGNPQNCRALGLAPLR